MAEEALLFWMLCRLSWRAASVAGSYPWSKDASRSTHSDLERSLPAACWTRSSSNRRRTFASRSLETRNILKKVSLKGAGSILCAGFKRCVLLLQSCIVALRVMNPSTSWWVYLGETAFKDCVNLKQLPVAAFKSHLSVDNCAEKVCGSCQCRWELIDHDLVLIESLFHNEGRFG